MKSQEVIATVARALPVVNFGNVSVQLSALHFSLAKTTKKVFLIV